MLLVEKRKFDLKNRLYIPVEYIKAAEGEPNGDVYVTFDEDTKKIELLVNPDGRKERKECNDGGISI